MEIKLLDENYDINSILITPWESFKHLKDFLIEDWKKYINSKLCTIYWVIENNNIIWYISISASILRLKEWLFRKIKINDLEDISIPIPWILIWKLLLSQDFRWKWIWTELIMTIISYCYKISKSLWVRFIIVDSNLKSVWFYEKYWFIKISENWKTVKMVFDLKQFDNIK